MDYQTFKDIRELVGIIASDLADSALAQGITNALTDIAKQTRFTYLQGSDVANTLRIDNQTGEMWKLTSEWNNRDGSTTLIWEPEPVVERQATVEPKPAEPSAERSAVIEIEPNTYRCVECHHDWTATSYPDTCPSCGRNTWDLPF